MTVKWIVDNGASPAVGVGAVYWWCWGQPKFEQCRAAVITAVDIEIANGMLPASSRSAEIAARTEKYCNSLCGPDPNAPPAVPPTTKVYKVSTAAKPYIGLNDAEIAALESCANSGTNCSGWTVKEARNQIDYFNSIPGQKQAIIQNMRNQNACDATKPGLLAGALREALAAKTGQAFDEATAGDTAFTSAEMTAWIKAFGAPPSPATLGIPTEAGKGSVTTITASEVCPNGWKLPAPLATGAPAPKPPEPAPAPVTTTTTAAPKKKTPWGLILGVAALGAVVAYAVADDKKKNARAA